MSVLDTICRCPDDVVKLLLSYYIMRPQFSFRIESSVISFLVIQSIGSTTEIILPCNTARIKVKTKDIEELLVEDGGQYEIKGEQDLFTITIDNCITIDDNKSWEVTIDIGSLPSLKIALSEYLTYLKHN